MSRIPRLFVIAFAFLSAFSAALAQTSTGSISGTVYDERQSAVPGATVTVRNADTGFSRSLSSDSEGRFRFVNLPIGAYELSLEAPNFSKYVQTGITLVVNQDAVIDPVLKAGRVEEVVTVTENASVLNTTTAEVATRFDERRLSELPIATNRNVFNVLLSVPGVSQISPNQSGFANGVSFSSNGGRLRSNNFMLDGQDINDPSVSGGQVPLNNPDAIREARIITNQFLAEYGRNSGSIVNFIGKSGTNEYHGSGFVFHNNENLNSCSNLDKAAGFCNADSTIEARKKAPRRKEFQYGFTFGGPLTFPWFGDGGDPFIWRGIDKTFIFGDFQRWTDRQLGSGSTINGAPTAAGRAALQANFGSLPQVQALLRFIPAAPAGRTTITAGGIPIEVGNITGSSSSAFNSDQGAFRIDHRFNDNHLIYGRYRGSKAESTGGGQVTPPGITNIVATKTYAATIVLNSILSSKISNEARIAWTRFDSSTNAQDPSSETIPSIEINDLGMTGFNALASRTAFGLAVNLPQFRINDTYQITDNMTYVTGDHALKFGVDLRRTDVSSFFLPTTRGRLQYNTLDAFLRDQAQVASINLPLKGGDTLAFYRWKEFYVFGQDEWKIWPNFTLTYGLRYEYPGDSFSNLKDLNERILTANNDNPGFVFTPEPKVDTDNFMPRIGFNWNPRTRSSGILGFLTGGDKTVLRGGYSRTYDANFININLNIFSSFPFVAIQDVPSSQPSFATIQSLVGGFPTIPSVAAALLQTRTVVSEDFAAPATDQFSLELQRELSADMVFKIGYVRTRGTGLFQTVDGNPRLPCPFGSGLAGTNTCNNLGINPFTGTAVPVRLADRVDRFRGTIRLRTNSASSIGRRGSGFDGFV
ncbi:MAG: carboxypeptidase regulatory-like domain-containing protein [Acidobacteria bacterium]|nr:carboxypeptidase regulatory-like domain-containing protein [Acidobacteriota bacterium]